MFLLLPQTLKPVTLCLVLGDIASGDSDGQGWESVAAPEWFYLYGSADLPIFLITAYAKAEKGNLSKAEQNALAKLAKSFFADYGRDV